MSSRFPRVRSYELMVIFHPETEEEALAEQIDRVRSYITDVDGTVTVLNRENPWGRRRLAYPIRHEGRDLRDGIYVLIYFDTEASRTVDIERELKLNTRIIRYMLIQQSTPTMEPPAPPPVEEAPATSGEGRPAPAADGPVTPVAAGEAAPRVEPTPGSTAAGLEASPGTPAEVAPAPYEQTGAADAGAPAAAEQNIAAPALDSSPAPNAPSQTLPPTDTTLVEVAAAAEGVEAPAPPADEASADDADQPVAADNAESADISTSNDEPSATATPS